MKWILWTIVAAVAAIGIVALVGWMLPVAHVASRDAHLPQPPEQVYAVVADVANYATWFEGVNRVEMLGEAGGKPRFREHTSTGPIVMEIEEAVAPRRMVTRIADPDQPFGGTWTFEIAGERGGSRLTITERGEIYNPIFRFMARYVFGYTATMETFLRSLEGKFAS